ADAQGIGTILDDDGAPSLAISDVSVTEGNTGSATNAAFTVTMSPPSGQTIAVAYATGDGTAIAGADYTATTGSLTFAPGQTSKTISVPVLGDILNEANETFTANLSGAVLATILDAQGIGTILDDDAPPTLAINDVSVTEGNTGSSTNATFTVTMSAASGQ